MQRWEVLAHQRLLGVCDVPGWHGVRCHWFVGGHPVQRREVFARDGIFNLRTVSGWVGVCHHWFVGCHHLQRRLRFARYWLFCLFGTRVVDAVDTLPCSRCIWSGVDVGLTAYLLEAEYMFVRLDARHVAMDLSA